MDLEGQPCVLLACFLPSREKTYVVREIFEQLANALGHATVYVGIQHGSHPDTEEIILSAASGLRTHMARVDESMHVDSDAAAYVEAMRLLRETGTRHSLCYFIHTKGITSNNDQLRRLLLTDLLDDSVTRHALSARSVGSYGPHLTMTRSRRDASLMKGWIHTFVPHGTLPVLPYFYAHTVWVAKGEFVSQFLNAVDPAFFSTPIPEYSDRYFAERDLPHLVDMVAGKRPSYGRLVGNHSTNYRRTRTREFLARLVWWQLGATLARIRHRSRPSRPEHGNQEPSDP